MIAEDTIQPSSRNGNEASLFAMPVLGVCEPEPPGWPRARLIWEYVEGLDLSGLYKKIQAVEGWAGRDATDPKILMALWLYATLEGIGSARQLCRLCEDHEPTDGFAAGYR
jgi:hypothetical protein